MAQHKYKRMDFANPNIFDHSAPGGGADIANAPANAGNGGGGGGGGAQQQQQGRPDAGINKITEVTNIAEPQKQEENATDHLFKHPLQNIWTLWYLENDRSKSWEDMQNEITSFDTVEDFWSLYNHIKPPSEIKLGSDYSLFKKGIRPMWEDAANNKGGRWIITLNKSSKADLDNLWLDVLLCLIGESFDHSSEICGAVVNIRPKNNKISIWTANGDNSEAALEIGNKLKDALRLGNQHLQYQLHKDAMVKQSSNVKSIYTL